MIPLFILCFCTSLIASPQELFDQGNYQESFNAYVAQPPIQPLELYTAGSAAYRIGRYAEALLWWRRAQQAWGPLGAHTVQIAIDHMNGQSRSAIEGLLVTLYIYCMFSPLWLWQILLLLCLLFISLRNRNGVRTANIFLYILFSLISFGTSVRYTYLRAESAVTLQQVELRSGPGAHFSTINTIPSAQEVQVLDRKQSADREYCYITNTDGVRGWVHENHIASI